MWRVAAIAQARGPGGTRRNNSERRALRHSRRNWPGYRERREPGKVQEEWVGNAKGARPLYRGWRTGDFGQAKKMFARNCGRKSAYGLSLTWLASAPFRHPVLPDPRCVDPPKRA